VDVRMLLIYAICVVVRTKAWGSWSGEEMKYVACSCIHDKKWKGKLISVCTASAGVFCIMKRRSEEARHATRPHGPGVGERRGTSNSRLFTLIHSALLFVIAPRVQAWESSGLHS
jgi:hypothetical protein